LALEKPCIDCGEREADVKRRRRRCRKCQYAREPASLRVCISCGLEEWVKGTPKEQCLECGYFSATMKKMQRSMSVDEVVVDQLIRGVHKGPSTKGERKEAVRRLLMAGWKRSALLERLGITKKMYENYRGELRAEGVQLPDMRSQNKGTPGNTGGGVTRKAA
jgi:hypothetical protein